MVELLRGIPPTVYAAIVAALLSAGIALLGVFISNRGQTNRLLLQLQHERNKQQAEFYRERVEELYLISDKWVSSLAMYFFPFMKVMRGEITYNDALDLTLKRDASQYDFTRLEMLIHMYFPDIASQYEAVTELREKANLILQEYKMHYQRGNDQGREFLGRLHPLVTQIISAGDDLRAAVIQTSEGLMKDDNPSRLQLAASTAKRKLSG